VTYKWDEIDGESYVIEEERTGRQGSLRLVVDPNDSLQLRIVGDLMGDVEDLEGLSNVLAHKVSDIRLRFERSFKPDPVDPKGFEHRWKTMGNSRAGGWTWRQECVIASLWGRVPLASIAAKVMEQRHNEMSLGVHRSIKLLAARGIIFRAREMGLISSEQARRYAGAHNSSSQRWPRYGSTEDAPK
jgi:hypothetical protein